MYSPARQRCCKRPSVPDGTRDRHSGSPFNLADVTAYGVCGPYGQSTVPGPQASMSSAAWTHLTTAVCRTARLHGGHSPCVTSNLAQLVSAAWKNPRNDSEAIFYGMLWHQGFDSTEQEHQVQE